MRVLSRICFQRARASVRDLSTRTLRSGPAFSRATPVVLLFSLCLSLHAATQNSPPSRLASGGQFPVRFEQTGGTQEQPSSFVARGFNYQFKLLPSEALIAVRKPIPEPRSSSTLAGRFQSRAPQAGIMRSLRLRFTAANPRATMTGQDRFPANINYLVGNDPSQWRCGAPSFGRVLVRDLYPGIDLVYYANGQRLEYDLVVEPGANPERIHLAFQGMDTLDINSSGELVLTAGADSIVQPAPCLYQITRDGTRRVDGHYRKTSASSVSFEVGHYDPTEPLIIDPVLSYSTFFGGNSGDLALSVKLDSSGFIYVAGETLSAEFPEPLSGFDTSFGGGTINGDAFVAKFNPTGSQLVYFTYLGGSGNEGALDLAVDAAGYAYVCGFTDSPNFPAVNAPYPKIHGTTTPNGIYFQDAFVAKLDLSGTNLLFSTFFGGTNVDRADALALGPAGDIFIAGLTYSSDSAGFPLLNPLPGQEKLHGPYDAFVAQFGPGGAPNVYSLVYSTYLGGTYADEAQGIAVDAGGAAYVTGFTTSTNFPTTNAYSMNLNGNPEITPLFDAFVTKLQPLQPLAAGYTLAYSTFLGGSNSDSGFRIAVDADGNAYVTGSSQSPEFPNTVTNLGLSVGFTNVASASGDVFLTRFGPAGTLDWSTRFGGLFTEVGWDIALDQAGNPFVVGTTSSTNFPTFNASGVPPPEKAHYTYESVFVTALRKDASSVLYSVVLGGALNDGGYGIAVDPAGNAYVVGKTSSTNFPALSPLQSTLLGKNDAFLTKISLEPTLQSLKTGAELQLRWRAFAPEYVLESGDISPPASSWSTVAEPPVCQDGWHTVTLGLTNSRGLFRLRQTR